MPAHVVEAAQLPIEAVGDDDRLVEDGDRHEVADSLQLVCARHELPGRTEDALLLALEDPRIQVIA
jgi:hypothetical protein